MRRYACVCVCVDVAMGGQRCYTLLDPKFCVVAMMSWTHIVCVFVRDRDHHRVADSRSNEQRCMRKCCRCAMLAGDECRQQGAPHCSRDLRRCVKSTSGAS